MSDFIFVNTTNFQGVMTRAAYREFRLQLSTGDYHTHQACASLPAYAAFYGYTDIDADTGEFFDIEAEALRA